MRTGGSCVGVCWLNRLDRYWLGKYIKRFVYELKESLLAAELDKELRWTKVLVMCCHSFVLERTLAAEVCTCLSLSVIKNPGQESVPIVQ